MVNLITFQTKTIQVVMPTLLKTTKIAVEVPILHLRLRPMRINHACRQFFTTWPCYGKRSRCHFQESLDQDHCHFTLKVERNTRLSTSQCSMLLVSSLWFSYLSFWDCFHGRISVKSMLSTHMLGQCPSSKVRLNPLPTLKPSSHSLWYSIITPVLEILMRKINLDKKRVAVN